MTKFEMISSIWCDLDKAYKEKGKNLSRLDFVKSLLGTKSGELNEVSFRKLLGVIQQDTSTDPAAISELCEKIENVYNNLSIFKADADLPESLNDLTKLCKQKDNSGINSLFASIPSVIPSIKESVEKGSILPLSLPMNGSACSALAKEYYEVIFTETELVNLFEKSLTTDKNSPLSHALIQLYRGGLLKQPLIVTDKETVSYLCSNFNAKTIDRGEGWAAFDMQDDFGIVRVVEV